MTTSREPRWVDSQGSASVPVADAHSDLLMELAFAQHHLGEANPMRDRWLNQLRTGGVRLQVCAIYVEPSHPDPLRSALALAQAYGTAVRRNPNVIVAVQHSQDLERIRTDRVGLMLALEGADCLGGEIWAIDVLAELGVQMMSLTHNDSNPFAAGCESSGGLTNLGRELLDRLRELDIVLDLAHASVQTFWDTLEAWVEGLSGPSDYPLLATELARRGYDEHDRAALLGGNLMQALARWLPNEPSARS